MSRPLPAVCLRMQRSAADAVARTGSLRGGERALLMISGGADSMALLSLVRAVDRRLDLGLTLLALHVDYGLRGADSDRDRQIVERACATVGVPLYVERLGGRLSGPDFQARARAQRYGLARALATEHRCDVIVAAHNRDDQAETVLYRLVKYATPEGIAGMRPRAGDLARPLLWAGAEQLRQYCRAARIEYGEDVTNTASLYARNRLRHEVFPRLEELNPRVKETLAEAAEQAAAEAEVLAAAVLAARRRVAVAPREGDLAAVDVAALQREPQALRGLILHGLVREVRGGDALVGRRLVRALERLAARTDDSGRVSLGRGLEAVRGRGAIRLRAPMEEHACSAATLEGAALAAAGEAGLEIGFCSDVWRARLLPGPVVDRREAQHGAAFVGLCGAPQRAMLRHPRRGDRFAPLGLGGETTVARYLAAARVPADLRPRVTVLEVDGRVAWVGGVAASRVAQSFRVAHSSSMTLHIVQEGT